MDCRKRTVSEINRQTMIQKAEMRKQPGGMHMRTVLVSYRYIDTVY